MEPLRIVFMSPDATAASGWFNPNAFPEQARCLVDASGERAALVRYHARMIHHETEVDLRLFEQEYTNHRVESLRFKEGFDHVAMFTGAGYLASLYGVFFTLKAFLDVYAKLVTGLIEGKYASARGFSRARVGKDNLRGGALINRIRLCSPKHFTNAAKLADVVEKHSRRWIDKAVSYRDTLAHFGTINGVLDMQMRIDPRNKRFSRDTVKQPTMPDGTPVPVYARNLLSSLDVFVQETLALLPGVDPSKLSRKGQPLSGQG
jgi:hypothetical protein